MNLIRVYYAMQREAARGAAPFMRAAGLRFSKKSRDNRIINALIAALQPICLPTAREEAEYRAMTIDV
jgi:hypothetical protein